MSISWRHHPTGGERQAPPVELRFVDMFMAAIGALVFMAMLLSYLMSVSAGREASQLRIYASLVPEPPTVEATNVIARHFYLSLAMPDSSTNTPGLVTYDSDHPVMAAAIDEKRFLLCNPIRSHETNLPFLLLLHDGPLDGTYSNVITVKTSPGGSIEPSQGSQKAILKVKVQYNDGKTTTNLFSTNWPTESISNLWTAAHIALTSAASPWSQSFPFTIPAYSHSKRAR